MFTIFAPTNAAVQERLKSLGFGYLLTSPYTDPDPGAKNVLKLIVSAHISPALPVSEALWTSPFLSQGTVIQSEAKDSRYRVEVTQGPDGPSSTQGIQLKASNGETSTTANVVSGNHESCKVL